MRTFEAFDDPFEIVAVALEKAGYTARAKRIRHCRDYHERYKQFCGLIFCPHCAEVKIKEIKRKWLSDARRMQCLTFTLAIVSLRSKHLSDLGPTITMLRKLFAKLRDKVAFKRTILSGVFAIEIKLTDDGKGWNVHIHVLLDAEQVDFEEMNRIWYRYTGGLGSFIPHRDPIVRRYQLESLADYACKFTRFCPDVEELTDKQFRILAKALHSRRLFDDWGEVRRLRQHEARAARERQHSTGRTHPVAKTNEINRTKSATVYELQMEIDENERTTNPTFAD